MKHYFLFVMFGCLTLSATAQEVLKKTVTVHLDSASLEQLIDTVKQQINARFYYAPSYGDSIFITVDGTMTLGEVLKKAFQGTPLFYGEGPDGYIYITEGRSISFSLSQPSEHSAIRTVHHVPKTTVKVKKGLTKTTPAREIASSSTVIDYDENKLFEIGSKTGTKQKTATITGYITNRATGEGISGASLAIQGSTSIHAVSDAYGYYTITMPTGQHTLLIRMISFADTRRQLSVTGDGKLSILMHDYVTSLKGVTISSEKSSNVLGTSMGMQRVDIKTIKQVPALMGEADILRVLQMLPGVTSASEGSTGLNVRGGNVDQNLVLLDGATVYNPSHFFGFFSGFNPDIVKDAELYKSSIPVRYGGRLSSVLEVLSREGNSKRFTVSGGIGPLSGHLTLEGPIGKKTSFVMGARSTYSDWILKLLPDDQYKRSSANFYDANLKATTSINDKNTVYFSGYVSGDRFRLDGDTLYSYGNKNVSVKWKHIFNPHLYANFGVGYDGYDFKMNSTNNKVDAFSFAFKIQQYHFNSDLIYSPDNRNKIEAGLSMVKYKLHPGDYHALDSGLAIPNILPTEQGLESALYLSDVYTLTPDLTIDAGFRYSMYNNFGPATQYDYGAGVNRDVSTIIDTSYFSSGKIVKTWHGPEPRVSARYSLSTNLSLKAAYNRTRQYIHMLSNTTVITPTDIWKLSDKYIRPAVADQVSLGVYRNFDNNVIETSVEVYYKWIQHTLTYKSGATLLLNHHIETDVANATGKAYGLEFLIKKTAGKLNGWLSYTYSRTLLKMSDPLVSDPTNGGAYFPADYDKPHVANLVGNYRFSHRFSVSLTAIYSTGRPITLPIAKYYYFGSYRVYYADRNQYRIPDYFRTDLSVNIEGNHKVRKLAHSSWTVGAYNITARRNAYSVYFTSENGKVNGYKLSIFGTVIPFVTYNFKF